MIYTFFSTQPKEALLAASIATLPPPTTATLLPMWIGVSLSSILYALIKFILVKNSFAEYTAFKFSPGIPIKLSSRTATYKTGIQILHLAKAHPKDTLAPTKGIGFYFYAHIYEGLISFCTKFLGRRNSECRTSTHLRQDRRFKYGNIITLLRQISHRLNLRGPRTDYCNFLPFLSTG